MNAVQAISIILGGISILLLFLVLYLLRRVYSVIKRSSANEPRNGPPSAAGADKR